MEEQEQEIIVGALSLFDKYGIRSVTMDDVAREMGISKKTIYKYFENKADLVHKCIMTIYDQVYGLMMEIHENSKNAIDELFDIDAVVRKIMESHNPGLQFQLRKYYPQTYRELYNGRKDLVNKMISENIESGQKDGLFRSDLEVEIVTHLYCSKVDTMPHEEVELMSKYPIHKVMRQSLEYHIRGIASDKGLKYLDQRLKKENNAQ